MRPSMMMGGRGLPPATIVGSVHQSTNGASPIIINLGALGAQPGDYCMIASQSEYGAVYANVKTNGGAAWPQDNYVWSGSGSDRTCVFRKVLTSTDIAGEVRFGASSNGYSLVTTAVYRGPNSAARRVINQDDDGGATHATPGFVRSPNAVGVVAIMGERSPSGGAISVSSPGGAFTKRQDNAIGIFRHVLADALPRSAYVDGAAVNWTGLVIATSEFSQLYELLIT